jgi:osmotically-inducible protein OsmY
VGAGDAGSGGGIPITPETDQDVIDAIRLAFFLDPDLPEDVCDVASVNRVVYLRGVVPTADVRQHAVHVASQVQGVNRVVDELRVVSK